MNSLPSFHSVLYNTVPQSGDYNFSDLSSKSHESSSRGRSLYENFCENVESSDASSSFPSTSASEVYDLPQVPADLQFDEMNDSDDDSAALLLTNIASTSRKHLIEGSEQLSKRPCLAEKRSNEHVVDSFYPESYLLPLMVTPEPSSESLKNRQNFSYTLSKDPRALLGMSMLLTNTLPPNIDSMGLTAEELVHLKYYASIKGLITATREGNVVTLVIFELFDKVIHKYINSNESSLQLQPRSGRFRYWSTASGKMLGIVRNFAKHNFLPNNQIIRTFKGVDSPTNVFSQFPERYNHQKLGEILYQSVTNYLKDINCTEERLISNARIGSPGQGKFSHVRSVQEHFQTLTQQLND